jgi:HD-like signal output (HDOD) protein
VSIDRAELERKRILFVDDDQALLEGLRDALRPYRQRWEMTFVPGAHEALAVLDEGARDVIVSDLRMPGMDGASLLDLVRERYPAAVRIVLSGHAEMNLVARAATVAHRLISKPCDSAELARVIERACALQDMAARVELDRRAMGASSLPSVPRLYLELSGLLASGTAGASDAGRIVERDIAMSAKVLQLANSAYFGRRSPVSRVTEAVAYLGLEALRALVLHAAAFREFHVDPPIAGFDLDELHRHCSRVARLASAIAGESSGGGDVFTAGLLHDVGLLMLASSNRGALEAVLERAQRESRPIHEVERQYHGVTHAEIGAHLLALWGLPHTVTEPVACHHDSSLLSVPFDGAGATYLANALIEEAESESLPGAFKASKLDLDYLRRAEVEDRLPQWRELAKRQIEESLQ